METIKSSFKVINWDFNTDSIEYYDVLPYLRREIQHRLDCLKKWRKTERWKKRIEADPNDIYFCELDTWEKLRDFIELKTRTQFWSRCEYEVIVTGWPQQNNSVKIDVYDQIKENIDVITDILWKEEI